MATKIQEEHLGKALSERYLAYALSTIVSRSLPDVRDGLKPVLRRLLFAMRLLKLDPPTGFKKCARVVGDVLGKYHPHGDASVYDALVRLAQDFSVRYPLVEGQGNFGNIDGDHAAAMRYTEARMTPTAVALMAGLDDNAVDFEPTYDGEEMEPKVMPSSFPNLLANGSSGIAVGMATNIPPHNMDELCDALAYLIDNPQAQTQDLMNFVKGPDFPTGGVLIEPHENLVRVYEAGKGAMKLRARWEKEELSHGQYQVVVTEIPYQVPKSDLITRIAKLIVDKKLPLLADIRDESADTVRIVLEPKNRTVDAELLMENLFQQTDLQVNFNLNMNVLDADGTPRVMSLRQVLKSFLDHRLIILQRRSRYRLEKINHRMEILAGYLIAYLNLDRVIEIIRNEDEPKPVLMKEFKLSEVQVESILNMKLRSLRRLEEMELKSEYETLGKEKVALEKMLSQDALMWKTIQGEIKDLKKIFGAQTVLGKRRTEIVNRRLETVDMPVEAFIEKEPITVILSEKGWIRALKGHYESAEGIRFKEGDELQVMLKAQTTDKLILFGTNGQFYTLAGDKIPTGRGFGEPVRLSIDVPEDDQIIAMFIYNPEQMLLVASEKGKGFLVKEEDVVAQTRAGKKILTLKEGDTAKLCIPADGDTVAVIGQNRKMLVFDLSEIPVLAKGQGVILQKYQGGGLSDIKVFHLEDGLSFPFGNGTRVERDMTPWKGKRASVGKFPPVGFPRSNRFS